MNMEHIVELHAPKSWSPATQYLSTGKRNGKGELPKMGNYTLLYCS